jgi:hypothetical protein
MGWQSRALAAVPAHSLASVGTTEAVVKPVLAFEDIDKVMVAVLQALLVGAAPCSVAARA